MANQPVLQCIIRERYGTIWVKRSQVSRETQW